MFKSSIFRFNKLTNRKVKFTIFEKNIVCCELKRLETNERLENAGKVYVYDVIHFKLLCAVSLIS